MTNDIRFGIIGTGSIADSGHGPALHDVSGVTLWSVLSRDAERAKQFAYKHGATSPHPIHTSLADFLADPALQAVIITSPDNLHAGHIEACARAGKHVFVEKPMVVSHEEGMRVIDICDNNDIKLGVGFHLRWHAGHRKLHQLVTQDQALGDLRHIRLHWTTRAENDSNWRANPELGRWWSLAANGSHCLDLMRWFADFEPRTLVEQRSLIGRDVWGGPHDETVMAQFQYSDGLTADITTSVLFKSPARFELYGSEGHALCENTLSRFGGGTITLNGEAFSFEEQKPFYSQIADFATAIRDNRKPEVSGIEGLIIVDDMIAIEENSELKTMPDLQKNKSKKILKKISHSPLIKPIK